MDTTDFQSVHNRDYDAVMEHVVDNDHELLALDTLLGEALTKGENEAAD